jgi:hypothetical protein
MNAANSSEGIDQNRRRFLVRNALPTPTQPVDAGLFKERGNGDNRASKRRICLRRQETIVG